MKRLYAALLFAACCSTASAQINSFNPPFVIAGSPAFNLTINGNFVVGMYAPFVTWSNLGSGNLTLVSNTATQIVVTVPANLLSSAGTAVITVQQIGNPTYTSNYVVRAPTPAISSLNPTSAVAGSPALQLTVNGSNFVDPDCSVFPCASISIVNWNGIPLTTFFVNTTQLTATVPANLMLSPVAVPITVVNPDGGTSNAVNFTVTYPIPTITSISPASANAGSPGFTLTVSGTGFFRGSTIQWNGISLPTTLTPTNFGIFFTAPIPASFVAQAGTASVTVLNPGQPVSNAALFSILGPPVITSLSPSSVNAGSAAFALNVFGSGFLTSSVIQWNGTNLPTTLAGTTAGNFVTTVVPATLVSQAGIANVTVVNPGLPASNVLRFNILGQPTLISVSPTGAQVGDPGFTLTVSGTFFQTSSTVLFNGQPLPTTFNSPNQLTAALSGSFISTAGTSFVSVATPGQLTTGSLPFNIGQQPLSLTSLSPNTVVEGMPTFILTVSGSGFTSQTTLFLGTQALATTFVSGSQLTATVPASLIAKAATVVITASGPNNSPSNGLSFVITPTPIAITSLSPASATAGGPAFTLTVTGSGFLPGVSAVWNGGALASTYVSPTQFTAVVPSALIANIVPVSIRANNPNGPQSNVLPFTIAAPTLTLTSIAPNTASAGGPAFTLTATGTGFVNGSGVLWNGAALATTFISATQLSALVPASLTAAAGTASVTVSNPGTTAAVSNALPFSVTAPSLSLTSISPNSATAGDPVLTLTATGTGFTNTSVVQWNGSALATSFVSSTQLTATVPANLLANPGTASVMVSNGNSQTGALTFTVNLKPVSLTITSLSPATTTAGSGVFTLTVNGTGFQRDAAVFWNSTSLPTTAVSAGQVTAVVPANLVAQPGTASITVTSGGATSNASTFTITLPPPPTVILTGPASIGPAQQPPIVFNLGSPYPLPLTGTVTLTFVPNALVPGDDPSIQFASGGRSLGFIVPANSLTVPSILLQTGTVAGTVTVTLKLSAGNVDVTPPGSVLTIQIPRQAPFIRTVQLIRNAAGIEVDISGFATSREVTQATFHFNIAAGSSLQVSDFTVPLTSTFAAWYGSTAAVPFGSQFTYAQPFTVQGSNTAIVSVTVTLTNSAGSSQPVTSN